MGFVVCLGYVWGEMRECESSWLHNVWRLQGRGGRCYWGILYLSGDMGEALQGFVNLTRKEREGNCKWLLHIKEGRGLSVLYLVGMSLHGLNLVLGGYIRGCVRGHGY